MVTPAPADHRVFVSYVDKSREYYRALGYANPYRWAYHQDAPFQPLAKPLAECRIGLITTSSLIAEGEAPPPFTVPGEVFSAVVDPLPDTFYTGHRAWDKEATHTDDLDSYFPIHRLQELAVAGRIGSVAPRFYGAPTEYSQRKTIEVDAPAILEMLREDRVDASILVAL
jgi:hypothetical protein